MQVSFQWDTGKKFHLARETTPCLNGLSAGRPFNHCSSGHSVLLPVLDVLRLCPELQPLCPLPSSCCLACLPQPLSFPSCSETSMGPPWILATVGDCSPSRSVHTTSCGTRKTHFFVIAQNIPSQPNKNNVTFLSLNPAMSALSPNLWSPTHFFRIYWPWLVIVFRASATTKRTVDLDVHAVDPLNGLN